MSRLPRPNPEMFPRMYAKRGKYLHRSWSRSSTISLCNRVRADFLRAVEGHKADGHLLLITFDPERAAKLKVCEKCRDLAGRFA